MVSLYQILRATYCVLQEEELQAVRLKGTCSVRKIRRQRVVEGQAGLEKRKAN